MLYFLAAVWNMLFLFWIQSNKFILYIFWLVQFICDIVTQGNHTVRISYSPIFIISVWIWLKIKTEL